MKIRTFIATLKRKDNVRVKIDNKGERLLKDIVINSDDNIEMIFVDDVMEIPINKIKIYKNKETIIMYANSKKILFLY